MDEVRMNEVRMRKIRMCVRLATAATFLTLVTPSPAQARPGDLARDPLSGPDVIVGDIYDSIRWGEIDDITAYSLGTDSCNVGDEPVLWVASTNEHPLVAQNMYRLKDDRFEQIGMSWLKHSVIALTLDLCDDCQDPGNLALLGVGCSDPYSADLNGDQTGVGGIGGLGPRFEVNAATGFFQFPYTDQGMGGDALYKRLQVHNDDLDPALNPGALYFVEGHYITADDAAAGNDDNNASYRQVAVDAQYDLELLGETQREMAAIFAWPVADPEVVFAITDVADDGRFILAAKASDLGQDRWHYEYALYNMSSDRSARAFTVPMKPGAMVFESGFHDIDYHSGEPFDGADWPVAIDSPGGSLSWSTSDFATDENANALRWGTLYNYWFDADTPPALVNAEIGLFRPGSPASVVVASVGPAGPAEIFADGFESGDTGAWN